MIQVVLLAIASGLIFQLLFRANYPKNFPPGPALKLPFFGNALSLLPDVRKGFEDLFANYGKVCGFWYGRTPAVLVSDRELIKQLSNSYAASHKKFIYALADIEGCAKIGGCEEMAGLILSSGTIWQDLRSFVQSSLKRKLPVMETAMVDEAKKLCKYLQRFNSAPVEVGTMFRLPVLNTLWIVVTGKRFEYDDARMTEMVNMLFKQTKLLKDPLMQLIMRSKAGYLFFKTIGNLPLLSYLHQREKFAAEIVSKHLQDFKKDNISNMVDEFILKIHQEDCEHSPFHGKNGITNAKVAIINLFTAGSDTTNVTLSWVILYMALYPDIQSKLQEELDGVEIPLDYQSKNRVPLVNATIHEVQRIASIVSDVTRFPKEDLEIGSFKIPKGSRLILNYYNIQRDPSVFVNPDMFDPMRHINDDGQFVLHPQVMPFGYGKRRCLGESLAKRILFYFVCGILNSFTVCKAHPNDRISKEPLFGVTLSPLPFKVKFIPRK